MHDIHVDHSGQIEKTNKPTAFAFSNKISRGMLVPTKVKQQAVAQLTSKFQKLRSPEYKLYAACFFLLVQSYVKEIRLITIDADFPGHEGEVKGMILEYLRRVRPFKKGDITFMSIGKKDRANLKALNIFRGDETPDHVVTIRELEQLL